MINDEFIKQLMQRGNIIKHYLIRIGVNPADAEEIVQDTLLKGLSNIDSIKPEKFMAWLLKSRRINTMINTEKKLSGGRASQLKGSHS